ncbi:uncharacterized protein PG986_007199 [Apiospora aurea]|uniref:Uncharacterized protein n=1 Tax=Apiospora aurea TaxID=335848 RepID=A0ABR1QBW0_9PEZI
MGHNHLGLKHLGLKTLILNSQASPVAVAFSRLVITWCRSSFFSRHHVRFAQGIVVTHQAPTVTAPLWLVSILLTRYLGSLEVSAVVDDEKVHFVDNLLETQADGDFDVELSTSFLRWASQFPEDLLGLQIEPEDSPLALAASAFFSLQKRLESRGPDFPPYEEQAAHYLRCLVELG